MPDLAWPECSPRQAPRIHDWPRGDSPDLTVPWCLPDRAAPVLTLRCHGACLTGPDRAMPISSKPRCLRCPALPRLASQYQAKVPAVPCDSEPSQRPVEPCLGARRASPCRALRRPTPPRPCPGACRALPGRGAPLPALASRALPRCPPRHAFAKPRRTLPDQDRQPTSTASPGLTWPRCQPRRTKPYPDRPRQGRAPPRRGASHALTNAAIHRIAAHSLGARRAIACHALTFRDSPRLGARHDPPFPTAPCAARPRQGACRARP